MPVVPRAVREGREYGYWVLTADPKLKQLETTTDDYATTQESSGLRFTKAFSSRLSIDLKPKRSSTSAAARARRFAGMVRDGHDAMGVDLPTVTRYWNAADNDRSRFIASSATDLPFADETFDLVLFLRRHRAHRHPHRPPDTRPRLPGAASGASVGN